MGEMEEILQFDIPKVHWIKALNKCHRDAGHQGQQKLQFLLQDHFLWPGMVNQIQRMLKNCESCILYESAQWKMPLHPIIVTTPLDLFHIDYMSIEMTMELNNPPKVGKVLVFQDHFPKHIIAYLNPNWTKRTVGKFLYQGYILIFRVCPSF